MATIESVVRARKTLRTLVTKGVNKINQIKQEEQPDLDNIQIQFEMLENRYTELQTFDQKIFEISIDNNATEEDILKEATVADEYREKFIRVRNVVASMLKPVKVEMASNSVAADSVVSKKKYKLPTLEIKKFSGEIKDWLQFWGLFRKIHEDSEMSEEDKFQFLL